MGTHTDTDALVVYVTTADDRIVGEKPEGPYVIVLGIAQDAGYPQAACRKSCCAAVWSGAQPARQVSCLGLVDPMTDQV